MFTLHGSIILIIIHALLKQCKQIKDDKLVLSWNTTCTKNWLKGTGLIKKEDYKICSVILYQLPMILLTTSNWFGR